MNWKQFYFSPDGRVIRREWWVRFFLPLLVIWVGAAILDTALYLALQDTRHDILEILFYLQFYPWFVVNAKRPEPPNRNSSRIATRRRPIGIWCRCLNSGSRPRDRSDSFNTLHQTVTCSRSGCELVLCCCE